MGKLSEYGWVFLLVTGLGILGFGVVVVVAPKIVPGYSGQVEFGLRRTVGVATIGMGIFGLAITLTAYRRFERWAWYTLWFYPIFWISHIIGWGVRPGGDDAIFTIISVIGLALSAPAFLSRRRTEQ